MKEFFKKNWVLLVLLVIDLGFVMMHYITDSREMFNLDMEFNAPTFYQSLKLYSVFLFSILFIYLSGIYRKPKEYVLKLFWFVISAFGIYVSTDEMLQLHERTTSNADLLFGAENVEMYESVFYKSGFNSADWLPFFIPVLIVGMVLFFIIFKRIYLQYKRSAFLLIGTLIFFVLTFVMEYIGTSPDLNMGVVEPWFVIEELSEMLGVSLLFGFVFLQVKGYFFTCAKATT